MENNRTLLSQDIENVQGSLSRFFTPDRIKNDFFEGKEREIYVVHNYKNESYEMELAIHDEFTVMSFAMKFEFRGFSIICIDVVVGAWMPVVATPLQLSVILRWNMIAP